MAADDGLGSKGEPVETPNAHTENVLVTTSAPSNIGPPPPEEQHDSDVPELHNDSGAGETTDISTANAALPPTSSSLTTSTLVDNAPRISEVLVSVANKAEEVINGEAENSSKLSRCEYVLFDIARLYLS